MLSQLIRPLLENSLRSSRLISTINLSTSNVLFQESFSGTNRGASSKPTEKAPNRKNEKENNSDRKQTGSDNEQEQSQQQGPADKEAERKSSKK